MSFKVPSSPNQSVLPCSCVPVQPPQYKLDPRLARLLGVHTQTRASIMQALWLYIKHNKLQDSHEKEYINCNRYFRQVSPHPAAPARSAGRTPFPSQYGHKQQQLWLAASSGLGLYLIHQLALRRPGLSEPLLLPGPLKGGGGPANADSALSLQIFNCIRMRFSEIPMKLAGLLQHPDPIIINHTIR